MSKVTAKNNNHNVVEKLKLVEWFLEPLPPAIVVVVTFGPLQ